MELRKIAQRNDDRAVSPVIGVILMVAITVILAAVIGAFVLNIGPSDEAAPTAQIQLSENGEDPPNQLVISHDGGDQITLTNVDLIVDGTNQGDLEENSDETGTLSAGESMETDTLTDSSNGENEIRLVHEPSQTILQDGDFELEYDTNG